MKNSSLGSFLLFSVAAVGDLDPLPADWDFTPWDSAACLLPSSVLWPVLFGLLLESVAALGWAEYPRMWWGGKTLS